METGLRRKWRMVRRTKHCGEVEIAKKKKERVNSGTNSNQPIKAYKNISETAKDRPTHLR